MFDFPRAEGNGFLEGAHTATIALSSDFAELVKMFAKLFFCFPPFRVFIIIFGKEEKAEIQ